MLNSHCIYACFGSVNILTFKVALIYSGVDCTFLQRHFEGHVH